MSGANAQQTGVLIAMLRALQGLVNSPQKKVVMTAIVAILVLGVKNAKGQAPPDVKNMKNEKGKVKRDFRLTLIVGQGQRQRRQSFLEARDQAHQAGDPVVDLHRVAVPRVPLCAARDPHYDEHLAGGRQRPHREGHRREELASVRAKSK